MNSLSAFLRLIPLRCVSSLRFSLPPVTGNTYLIICSYAFVVMSMASCPSFIVTPLCDFEQIRKVVLTYKDAAGMWWADKWRPLVGCIVNLTLNIVLVKNFGVVGVMLSTVISYAFIEMPWETHVLFQNYFKHSEKDYYIEMFAITLKMLIAGFLTYYICTFITVSHVAYGVRNGTGVR